MLSSNNKNNAHNILVVDDQAITRELLARAISAQGYTVDTASDGEEALRLWLQKKYAMVITDCHMPTKDGYQLCKDIRNTEKLDGLSHTLVVAWSANSKEEEQESCINAGIDDFLSKPINVNQLKQLLAKLCAPMHDPYSAESTINQSEKEDLIIDFNVLSQAASDEEGQNRVIQDLLSYIKHGYQSLEQYVATQNLAESVDLAHRLKGACRMVGANKAANAFAAIEHLSATLYQDNIQRLLNRLKQAITELEQSVSFETNSVLAGD